MDLIVEELTCLQEDTARPASPLARSYEKVFPQSRLIRMIYRP